MEFPNGNKTIALTPNMKFNPYIFCSRDTDKLKIKKISKPPIIVAFAWSMSLSSIKSIGYPYSELLRSITIFIIKDRHLLSTKSCPLKLLQTYISKIYLVSSLLSIADESESSFNSEVTNTPTAPSQISSNLGSSGEDLMSGTPSNDLILRLQGADTIRGNDGLDVIQGDEDPDIEYP